MGMMFHGKYGTYMGHIWTYGKYVVGVRVKTILTVIFFVIFNDYLARTIRACPRE